MEYTFKDPILLGGIAGALGVLTRDLYSFLSIQAGLAQFYFWQQSADLFIEGKEIQTFIGNMVGFLADLIFGAILGIAFVYFLKFTSNKNIIIKGWGFGLIAWLFLFGMMLGNLPGAHVTAPKDALGNFSSFIGHSIYGISLGIYAKILLNKYDLLTNK